MSKYSFFLSVVCVLHNKEAECKNIIKDISNKINNLVSDYEIIIVDNSSTDKTLEILKKLTIGKDQIKNMHIYSLTSHVEENIAAWAGVENSIGDYVITANPDDDDINFIPEILEKTIPEYDIVFIENKFRKNKSPINYFFKNISNSKFKMVSRKTINFLLNHPKPYLIYNNLSSITGFNKIKIEYFFKNQTIKRKAPFFNIKNFIIHAITTSHFPIRTASILAVIGSFLNLIYSLYVIVILIFKSDVAPGWATLSLQQSGMFFLFSLVLLIICEYLANINSFNNEGPIFYIGQEFSSKDINEIKKLNIEDLDNN